MTYEIVFEHEPPIKGRRVCLTNVGGVSSPEEAEAVLRKEFPGVVRVKRVHIPGRWKNRPEHRAAAKKFGAKPGTATRPVKLPSDLLSRILGRQAT